MANRVRRSRRLVAALVAQCALALAVGAACHSNQPFAEPSPGVDVRVTFLQPHGIAVTSDSVIVVSEMRGRFLALRGDTVVVRITRLTGVGHPTAWAGHEVSFARDGMTRIEQTSFDKSPTGTVALLGMSWLLLWMFRNAHY